MKKNFKFKIELNNPKHQLIILAVLLLLLGVANYINYYGPPKPIVKILQFSKLTQKEQLDLINEAKARAIIGKDKQKESEEKKNQEVKTLSAKDDNYLNYAVDSNGALTIWKKQNLIVHVSSDEFRSIIYQALSDYNNEFDGYFKFLVTKKPEKADIIIDVVNSFDSNKNPDSVYMAGVTNTSISGQDKSLTKAHVQLLAISPNTKKKVTAGEIYRVTLHEVGHAIGIIGHSPNEKDIMFASSGVSEFSLRDKNTIKMMYSGDEKLISNLTKNYSSTKLEESEKYVKMSPKKALAWVNLGKTYYDQGKKEKALDAYKQALMLEPENPTIYQSMAECYYLSKKYEAALKQYENALSYSKIDSEKSAIYTMIGMCYSKQENKEQEAQNAFLNALQLDYGNKSYLKNYLVMCVQLEKKGDALSAIKKYQLITGKMTFDDEFLDDTARWASK